MTVGPFDAALRPSSVSRSADRPAKTPDQETGLFESILRRLTASPFSSEVPNNLRFEAQPSIGSEAKSFAEMPIVAPVAEALPEAANSAAAADRTGAPVGTSAGQVLTDLQDGGARKAPHDYPEALTSQTIFAPLAGRAAGPSTLIGVAPANVAGSSPARVGSPIIGGVTIANDAATIARRPIAPVALVPVNKLAAARAAQTFAQWVRIDGGLAAVIRVGQIDAGDRPLLASRIFAIAREFGHSIRAIRFLTANRDNH